MSHINTKQSAQPVWVWAAIVLQFLILFSLTPAFSVVTSLWSYPSKLANPLSMAIRVLMPTGVVIASLVGLWHRRKWGWVLATLMDGVMCVQALLALPEFGVPGVLKFAALVVLLQRPVRAHFFGLESRVGGAIPWPRVPSRVSDFAQRVWSRPADQPSRISSKVFVVAIFCLAGFLSAWTYCSYSAWVESLYKANYDHHPYGDIYAVGADGTSWYAENSRIDKYNDRERNIFFVSFPVALSVALLIAIGAGWLPRILLPRMLGALVPAYLAPAWAGITFTYLAIFLPNLGPFPALALAACMLTLSAMLFTSRWPWWLLFSLCISSVICLLNWRAIEANMTLVHPSQQEYFFIPLEMIWASVYGWTLTSPGVLPKTGSSTIVRAQKSSG